MRTLPKVRKVFKEVLMSDLKKYLKDEALVPISKSFLAELALNSTPERRKEIEALAERVIFKQEGVQLKSDLKEEFVVKSRFAHGDKYDYSEVEICPLYSMSTYNCSSAHPPVKIRCRRHNHVFWMRPYDHYYIKNITDKELAKKMGRKVCADREGANSPSHTAECCQRGNDLIFLHGGYHAFLDYMESLAKKHKTAELAFKNVDLKGTNELDDVNLHRSLLTRIRNCEEITGRKINFVRPNSWEGIEEYYKGYTGLITLKANGTKHPRKCFLHEGKELYRQCVTCGQLKDKEKGFYSKCAKEPHVKRHECKECWRELKVKGWQANNPEKWKEVKRTTAKKYYEKRKADPLLRMVDNLRSRVSETFGAARKNGFDAIKRLRTLELLGGESWEQIKNHLESQFRSGMTWDNYGEWHIDHIIPVDYFIKHRNFMDENVQKECFHWSNLQPLWASVNISKSNKMPHEWEEPVA